MNLHSIVQSAIGSINPHIIATVSPCQGYVTQPDGTRVPTYGPPTPMLAQRQPAQYNDVKQLDSLNLQGTRCRIYVNGALDSLSRYGQRGGDLITFPDGSVWLVAVMVEDWSSTSGWTCVLATLQNGF